MEKICQENQLLIEQDGVVRVPFLVKGRLLLPPAMSRKEILSAFEGCGPEVLYLKLPQAQLAREPVIDRDTLEYSSEYLYQVLPSFDASELIETDIDKLVRGPYALSVSQIREYLQGIAAALEANWATVDRVRQLCLKTSEYPDIFLNGAFASLQAGLDLRAAEAMIDQELSAWQIPGRKFLEGWVDVPAQVIPGMTPFIAQALSGAPDLPPPAKTSIRAMPTRQLHITAGNAPQVPLISALRLILTKSAGVVKFPFGAVLPGMLLSLAAYSAAPEHPLTQNISTVYWQGGDESIENTLFMPGAFDRIVVWGAPEAVTSVQARAVFTKTVCFNPRYGVSLIGNEAFTENLEQVAFLSAMDALINNQKACTSSLVQYVEGTEQQVRQYGGKLAEMLARWDQQAPPFVLPANRGQIKRMRRGKYARAEWLTNTREGGFTSGVAIAPDEIDILDHPMCRLVILRRVEHLSEALAYLHQGVSMAGVYPEARRLELRDAMLARGVSSVLPLGQCERVYPGIPQDGMLVLSQLVDWKNG